MGGTQTKESEREEEKPLDAEGKLYRARPHIDAQEQALVRRLMEMYPRLDQLMAESIVWDYQKKKLTGSKWVEDAIPYQGGTLPRSYVTNELTRTLSATPTGAHTFVSDAPKECSEPTSGTPNDEAR